MSQLISEELQQEREEILLHILDDFIQENYEVPEDYVMTEEDAYIFSIVYDHFMENYKFPDVNDVILESVTGYDVNTPLYEELYDVLLDESIGSFVAGAAHGIRNLLSKRAADSATKEKEKASKSFEKHTTSPSSNKLKADVAQAKFNKSSAPTTPTGTFKHAYEQGKISAAKAKAEKAKAAKMAAETKRKSKVAKHQSNVAKTQQLAKKIDTGVENVKNRAKKAVSAGAERVGGILGKAVGSVRGI